MKAFIYTGGAIDPSNITEHPKGDDLRIAADSGYRNALALGETPDLLLGDFDSLGDCEIPKKVERLQVPAEKDFTDTQLAVDTALKKGATEIVILGGLDGRLDHTLSNLAILEDLNEKRIHAVITNGFNRVRYLHATSTLLARSGFRYVSLLALSEKVKGVSIEGCKYPLKNATLNRNFQYAVSNEITGNCALISVRKGGVYIVESREP
ncbi:MAG: thiamine diphosphokinase [Clostridia bacterium]|nr:thiamine diphosphokinase [Clostridia bacterium]